MTGFARSFEGGDSLETCGEWEGAEAVGGSIAKIVLHRRRKEAFPDFVGAQLEDRQSMLVGKGEHSNRVCVDATRLKKRKTELRASAVINR